jgi:hypothetical protein
MAKAKKVAPKKVTKKVAPKKVTKKVAPKKVTKKVAPKKVTKKVAPKKVTRKKIEETFCEVSEFKGNPVIRIPIDNEGKYFLTFGITKADAIVKHFGEIKQFNIDFPKKPKK